MKNIYIDCGANLGQGYERLKRVFDLTSYELYMFDIIPAACNALKEKYPHAKVFNQGIWSFNEIRDIQIEKATLEGIPGVGHESNVLQDTYKISDSGLHHEWDILKIDCIDFSEFLSQFSNNNEIFVKMDIEGAEYEVMDRLIDTGTIKHIKKLNIEWHPNSRKDSPKSIEYYNDVFVQYNIKLIQQPL